MARQRNTFLLFAFCVARLIFAIPTSESDVPLTAENALDGDDGLDEFNDFHPTPQKLAEDVAGAFVKGLEDSIEGIVVLYFVVFPELFNAALICKL